MPASHRPLRRLLSATALLGAAILWGGCAATPVDSSASAGTASESGTDSGFPLTLHNAYGDVTISEAPERVATLGYADEALAVALGADVVAAPESFTVTAGAGDEKTLPYIDALSDDIAWFNPMSVDVEQIAASEPDIILATAAFTLDDTLYAKLSAIAPVVTYEEGLYAATSEESAERIGAALGKSTEAEKLIDTAADAVATIKEELPGLDGGTFLYGQARDGVVVMLVEKENVTARFMQELGLVALPAVADLGGEGSVPGSVDVSFEQAGLFNDAGVLFMTYQSDALRDAFEQSPIVAAQPIMSSRYVPVDLETATALQDPNVVAVPWLLEQLRPGLELIPAAE